MEAPSPFSEHNPNLQIAWDSTSLKALQSCPRKYQYSILEGWRVQGGSNILEFGIHYHAALAVGMKVWAREDRSHSDAQLASVKYVMNATWGEHPWSGRYVESWRCKGEAKFKNEKGNAAKCPYSHKGKWFLGDGPPICGECGGGTQTEERWISADKARDRYALVRLVSWYWEEQPRCKDAGLQVVNLGEAGAAVELSFRLPTGYQNDWGEDYIICGHIDRLVRMGDEVFFSDYKTTKKALGRSYFEGYSPDTQMDTYDLAASILYPKLRVKGGIVEGAQTMVGGAKFTAHPIHRSESQREEWLEELGYWFEEAEKFAKRDVWPMNRSACWLCQFKPVCSKPKESRERVLKADYVIEKWNPLQSR